MPYTTALQQKVTVIHYFCNALIPTLAVTDQFNASVCLFVCICTLNNFHPDGKHNIEKLFQMIV